MSGIDFTYYTSGFFLHLWIQFGTGLCILLALMELVKKRETKFPGGMFLLALLLASVQSRLGFTILPNSFEKAWAWTFYFSSIWAIGPTLLLVSRNMVQFALSKEVPIVIHFIPACIVFLLELSTFFLPEEARNSIIKNAASERKLSGLTALLTLGFLHQTFYCLYLWMLFRRVFKEVEIHLSKFVYLILINVFASVEFSWLGFFLMDNRILAIGASFITLGSASIFLFSSRYPNFFVSLKSELRQRRYERTQLGGIDLNAVQIRLKEFMEEERIYQEETLKIQDLAQKLLISPHQLSRVLNETYGRNFNEFVNGYRIEEAKKLLLADEARTVLSIGYEVGFNSKSTFNAQFLRITGKTPVEWRKISRNS
ncbi:AraC family transcriptional regulator [Leptospira perolatii]|uniref:AraC family transcriptional regulator n=2 Tax=Leptospira perolatii TaxID=2023191 RepID=A0A2M9ZTB4_9LEPT|nr:AraC family transcriptional regulator [Leptospira perolatii]PJZ75153.1 AraC family transcriptional regulator [Leptospira perolatii]